jgi:hypothetical protein
VNLLWRPWLAFLKEVTEFVELCRGGLRRPAAAEAGTESLDTTIIPRAGPSTRRGSRDPDALTCFLACIARVEILHVARSSDESRPPSEPLQSLDRALNRTNASLKDRVDCCSLPPRRFQRDQLFRRPLQDTYLDVFVDEFDSKLVTLFVVFSKAESRVDWWFSCRVQRVGEILSPDVTVDYMRVRYQSGTLAAGTVDTQNTLADN